MQGLRSPSRQVTHLRDILRAVRFAVLCAVVVALWPGDAMALDPARHVSQYVHRHYGRHDGLPHNLSNSLVQMADGYLWAGSEEGLSRFDGHTFTTFARKDGMPFDTVSALAAAGDVLWIGTRDNGLMMRARGVFTLVVDPAIGQQVRALAIDAAGDVWVGTRDRGVARLHDGKVVATFTQGAGLPSNDVRDLHAAADGSMWIGTFGGAVHVIAGGKATLDPGALGGVVVHAIVDDKHGDIWFGTANGLARWHDNALTTIDVAAPGGPAVTRLLADHDGNLWLGGPRGLVRRTDAGHLERLTGMDARVLALELDRQGGVWVGTELGLDELCDGDVLPLGAAEGLTDEAVYGVLEDTAGTIWVGATEGLFRMPSDGSAPKNVASEHGTVYAIHEDPEGDVWAGSRDGSIGRWHANAFTWLATTTWEQIRVIAEAPGGLWIGSDHGLFRARGKDIEHATPVILERTPEATIVSSLVVDRAHALWVGTEGRGLRHITESGQAIAIPRGGPSANSSVTTLELDADGALWVTTEGSGLWLLRGDTWSSLTQDHGLFDDKIWRMLDDGAGSLWMSSNQGVSRVSRAKLLAALTTGGGGGGGDGGRVTTTVYSDSDGMRDAECNGSFTPAGWRTRDGRLLFPTASGLAIVTPKGIHPIEPQPAFVEAIRIDGQPATVGNELTVPAGAARLEIDYTAAELHSPDRLHFRYKLEPFDATWHDARGERLAQYTNLSPGDYRFVVEAGIDGVWRPGQIIAVTAEPQFYQTTWFRILAVLVAALAILAVPLLRVRQLRASERILDERVQEALRDVKTLSGLIPICAWCKKIRDDKGYWNLLEAYLTKHTDAKLTHGICPACVARQEAAEDAAHRES